MLEFRDYIKIFMSSCLIYFMFYSISGGNFPLILFFIILFLLYKLRLKIIKNKIKVKAKRSKYFEKFYNEEEE